MDGERLSEVRGPVAMIVTASRGIDGSSSRRISIFGCPLTACVTAAANSSRSTESETPLGTRWRYARRMSRESRILSSSLSSQGALPSWSDLKELLQTISARASVLWAGVGFTGRISYSLTLKPAFAICQAASEPANPPPATIMGVLFIVRDSTTVCSRLPGEGGSAGRQSGLRLEIGGFFG